MPGSEAAPQLGEPTGAGCNPQVQDAEAAVPGLNYPRRGTGDTTWVVPRDSLYFTRLKSIKGSCHNLCTASKDLTYKELKNLLNSKNIMLIDVRERWEILEHGKIPGSVNIPLDEVDKALQMNPRDFKEKYQEEKPSKSDSLVFSCLAGVRSKVALDMARSLGFHSAHHYAGGWKEWATYEFSEKQGN
ncbi:thiosulfate sulfurtransferase/rhodanese-like domain-containing protein 3 [Ctenodactylus gundi]